MKESTTSLPSITVDSLIDQRFKVVAELSDGLGSGAFLAEEQDNGAERVVFAVSGADKAALRRLGELSHAHLAHVVDVIDAEGGAYVIAERVEGETLVELLAKIGKKQPVDAVRSALRLVDALSAAHQHGAAHGRVHPGVVIVEPKGRPGPVLALAGEPPADSFYRSPDRGAQGPSQEDDSWAIAAVLLNMLTGKDPPSDGFETIEELADFGVSDPALQKALLHSLRGDPAERSEELRPLKRDLARWFVEHAGEEPFVHPPTMSSSPPPLPESKANRGALPPVESGPLPSTRTKNRLPMFAIGGLVFGLGAAWAASTFLTKPEPEPATVAPKPSASMAPATSADAIDLGEVDIEGESDTEVVANDKLSSCVSSYLPEKTFEHAADLTWVCSMESPRKGADQLRASVVKHSPGRRVSRAMELFSRMGWYDMVAFSVVRAGCCPEAPPLKLPDPSEGCERIDHLLSKIGHEVVDGQPFESSLDEYTRAAKCEAKAGKGANFKKPEPPGGGEQEAFLEYTKALK